MFKLCLQLEYDLQFLIYICLVQEYQINYTKFTYHHLEIAENGSYLIESIKSRLITHSPTISL